MSHVQRHVDCISARLLAVNSLFNTTRDMAHLPKSACNPTYAGQQDAETVQLQTACSEWSCCLADAQPRNS